MKKLLLTMVAAAAASLAFAQTKTTFGIKAGVNFASLQASSSGSSVTATSGSVTMFTAGAYADAPLGNNGLSLQPGLYYTGKGGNSNDGQSTGKLKFSYLQIPVNLVYSVPLSAGKFYFGGGPYAAYALSAKAEDKVNGQNVSVDLTLGSDNNSDIKRTDFGITVLIGFQFTNKLSLGVNSDFGLTSVLPGSNNGYSLKNRVYCITAGYSF
ncbi:porin family protein [Mucilaginibacter terrae]|uniref:Outer membrane protein beta-barrel domain-containing protein n=1 Tax=Mucilaginibacter terrae TaxID=1955052 RepID=A0ABU3GZ55_9SPHI|nr:porin family protein [Mucilaginibacter terrae]MDT3405047.1 hypothetical protein [Mucilaginibacter terrae]